jgi:hypothetical protein
MLAVAHYENANFLRGLAESLTREHSKSHKPEQVALLQRLANEELAEAEHVEWVRAKVAAACADTRPTLTTAQVLARLDARYEKFPDAV